MALGPVAHRVHVDVDHHAHPLALVAVSHRFLDVREELEFVFHVLGRKHGVVKRATFDAAHVFHAVDDLQVARSVDEASIAGVVPAVGGQHLGGGLGVLVVLLEQAGRLHQDFAVRCQFDLHPFTGHAHRVGARFVVGLQADEHRSLSRTVELLDVDADGAVEAEQIRSDGLACGVGHAHPAEAQAVAQRAVHQRVAQGVLDRIHQAQRLAVHLVGADAAGQRHASVEQLALEGAGVFHADHHRGEQALEHARWREVVGGPDFFQVDGDGAGRLGAVHHIARHQPLCVREDVLPDPGRRQVGQHLVFFGQLVELCTHGGAVDQGGVGVDHALGFAGGTAGEKHRRHIVGLTQFDLLAKRVGVNFCKRLARANQLLQRTQARLVVLAQPARIVKINVRQLRAFFADVQHFVHLLLVFHHHETHIGVVDGVHTFRTHRVLVQRHRDCAQRLRGQHGGVEPGAVGADHHHVFMAFQARLVQAAGNGLDQLGHLGPADGLPDAVFLFAHGGPGGAALRVVQQQPGESRLHVCLQGLGCCSQHSPVLHSGRDVMRLFDVMLSVERQLKGLYP